MPKLNDVGMIAADTSRTKVYAQVLLHHGLLPAHALIMKNPEKRALPGQAESGGSPGGVRECMGATIRPEEALEKTFDQGGVSFDVLAKRSLNEPEAIAWLEQRPESVWIYSGYGGILLRRQVLSLGKRFLHVHGGYLPDYKGSTTNYYSLIADDECGASALFLNENIDSGPVLVRRKFPPPADRMDLDHGVDPALRAEVLVDALRDYVDRGDWHFELENTAGGETYFIMHPVLRHIAMLAE